MTPPALGGIPVVVSGFLPLEPSVGENARRVVRHGLKEAFPWLKIEVGPKPDEATHVLLVGGTMMVSPAAYESLKARVGPVKVATHKHRRFGGGTNRVDQYLFEKCGCGAVRKRGFEQRWWGPWS